MPDHEDCTMPPVPARFVEQFTDGTKLTKKQVDELKAIEGLFTERDSNGHQYVSAWNGFRSRYPTLPYTKGHNIEPTLLSVQQLREIIQRVRDDDGKLGSIEQTLSLSTRPDSGYCDDRIAEMRNLWKKTVPHRQLPDERRVSNRAEMRDALDELRNTLRGEGEVSVHVAPENIRSRRISSNQEELHGTAMTTLTDANCQGHDAPHADGPEGGRWVWWNNKRSKVPRGIVYRLLEHMWDRDSAHYDDLIAAEVFDTAVMPGTVRSYANKVNNALPTGFPWRLSADSGSRQLTKDITQP
jgi:hypothetical protein